MMGKSVAVEQQTYLAPSEQVSRGLEILSMLGVQSQPCECHDFVKDLIVDKSEANVAVVVKHTFIEVVAPVTASRMNRSMSDSALMNFRSDLEQPWDSEKPWKKRLADKFQDLSDASTNDPLESTNDPLEAEDFNECFYGRAERKDTCWSDDEGMMDMTSMAPMYQVVDASWWMPMGYENSTMSDMTFMAWPESMDYSDQTMDYGVCHNGETDGSSEEWQTTVMLRNMPNNYTRDMFLQLVDSMGFKGKYDFAYLPVDFKSQAGLGYGFVNFMSSEDALRCFDVFEGYSDWIVPSEKVCTVTWGTPYQGLQAHIERYQNSPVMHPSIVDEWKPVIFKDGVRVPFPPPTKHIKVPKVRKTPSNQIHS
jgi:hypothetical protein